MVRSGKLKVLMLGWEYPPFLNGGLGVACEGLSQALSAYVDLGVMVPMAPPGARTGDLKVTGLNEADLEQLSHGEHPVLERYEKLGIPIALAPYADAALLIPKEAEIASADQPVDFLKEEEKEEAEIQETEAPEAELPAEETVLAPSFVLSEPYGEDLYEKVLEYGHLVTDLAAEQDFDLIHAHDWMTFLPGMELQKATGKPLVLHVHSLSYDRSGPETQGWIYELEKEAMEKADLVIPVSLYTAEIIEQYYGISRDKLRPVHNAITPVQPYHLPRPFPEQLVVFLGRLSTQKGPDHFLDIAFRVLAKNNDVRFVLAGHGDLEESLMLRVAEHKMGDRIHFTGFLGRSELHDLLAMANIFVMPSQSDPFGLAALEAAQFGLPCLLSRQCGVREVLPEAHIFEHWDSDQMAGRVLEWLEHPEQATQLGQQLQERVAHMDWDHTARAVARIYQDLL